MEQCSCLFSYLFYMLLGVMVGLPIMSCQNLLFIKRLDAVIMRQLYILLCNFLNVIPCYTLLKLEHNGAIGM